MKAEKITGPFHPITAAEARQWYKDGLLTTSGYLWTIRRITCPPNIDFVIPNVVAFCDEWGISRAAFYRAVKQLDNEGYMNWEATHGLRFKDSKKVVDFPPQDKKCLTSETLSHERDTKSHDRDSSSRKRDSQSHDRDSDIYIDRARSSDISNNSNTTDNAAAVENDFVKEKEESAKPTQEEVADALNQIRQLSPEIEINPTVRKTLIRYWTNFPAALAHVKKAVRENWKCKLTGLFIKSLRQPPEELKTAAIEPKKFPRPSTEQLALLASKGRLEHIALNAPGYPQVVAVHGVPWWEVLGLKLEDIPIDE